MFFSFFESRNDPDKDDVIFWATGGPGCASELAVLFEHGTSILEVVLVSAIGFLMQSRQALAWFSRMEI